MEVVLFITITATIIIVRYSEYNYYNYYYY